MNQSWYHAQSWYAPLVSDEAEEDLALKKIEELPDREGKKRRKRHSGGLTPGRIVGLMLILIVVIVGSSLAFRQIDGSGEDQFSFFDDSSDEDTEMPDTPADFFEQFYEDVESSQVEVNIPRTEDRPAAAFTMQAAPDEELSLQELYEKCAPSIVSISAYKGKNIGFFWGSGIVIREDGLILTNTHVLEDCDRAVVTLDDGSEYEAELIGADGISDIAMLKIDAKGLSAAEMGESTTLRVGDRVAAIGNPLGEDFRNTLTDGIISAIERGMSYNGRSMTLLQTNTAINEGKKISFYYLRYEGQKEKHVSNNGEAYVFSPHRLVWNGDYYYMIGWSDKHGDVAVFRIDRIQAKPEILDVKAHKMPKEFKLNNFLNTTFHMFQSEAEEVELECDLDTLDSVTDRFGDKLAIDFGNKTYHTKVTVAVNHVFYGWVFGFGGKVKIVSPENAVKGYKEMVENAYKETSAPAPKKKTNSFFWWLN